MTSKLTQLAHDALGKYHLQVWTFRLKTATAAIDAFKKVVPAIPLQVAQSLNVRLGSALDYVFAAGHQFGPTEFERMWQELSATFPPGVSISMAEVVAAAEEVLTSGTASFTKDGSLKLTQIREYILASKPELASRVQALEQAPAGLPGWVRVQASKNGLDWTYGLLRVAVRSMSRPPS